MAKSVGTKGNPLESSKPFCVKERWWRRPLTQNAASWTRCKAMRGQIVCPSLWLQAQSKSQVPRRRCSGAKSQIPTWLPEILSASLERQDLLGLDLLGHAFRATGVEFFLQTKVADDSLNASNANE